MMAKSTRSHYRDHERLTQAICHSSDQEATCKVFRIVVLPSAFEGLDSSQSIVGLVVHCCSRLPHDGTPGLARTTSLGPFEVSDAAVKGPTEGTRGCLARLLELLKLFISSLGDNGFSGQACGYHVAQSAGGRTWFQSASDRSSLGVQFRVLLARTLALRVYLVHQLTGRHSVVCCWRHLWLLLRVAIAR